MATVIRFNACDNQLKEQLESTGDNKHNFMTVFFFQKEKMSRKCHNHTLRHIHDTITCRQRHRMLTVTWY